MGQIDKQGAKRVIRKLGAELQTTKKNRPHDTYTFSHDGKPVLWFGITRSSNKNAPVGNLPRNLQITHKQCVELATCTLSKDEYTQILLGKGVISVEQ